jgi:hypothetical protein
MPRCVGGWLGWGGQGVMTGQDPQSLVAGKAACGWPWLARLWGAACDYEARGSCTHYKNARQLLARMRLLGSFLCIMSLAGACWSMLTLQSRRIMLTMIVMKGSAKVLPWTGCIHSLYTCSTQDPGVDSELCREGSGRCWGVLDLHNDPRQ